MKFFLFFLLIFCGIAGFSAPFHIFLNVSGEKESYEISLCRPIDNVFSSRYPQEVFNIPSGREYHYISPVSYSSPIVVQLYINHKNRFFLPVCPGDTVYLKVKDVENGLKYFFEGSNGAGLNYYNSLTRVSTFFVYREVDSLLSVSSDYHKSFFGKINSYSKRFLAPLDSLYLQGKVTECFYRIAGKDLQAMVYQEVLGILYSTIEKLRSVEKLKEIETLVQRLVNSLPPDKDLLGLRFGSLYVENIFYRRQEILKKKNLWKEKEEYKYFGPYACFFLAPEEMQKAFFGSALMTVYRYDSEEMDRDYVYGYLKEHFPESEYLHLIEKVRKREMMLQKSPGKDIYFLSDSLDFLSLQEVLRSKDLQGHYVFVDIWASWCAPCKQEFAYRDSLEVILKEYNLRPLYLSIDEKRTEKAWRKNVRFYDLKGYHIRVSEALYRDLKEKVYKDSLFYVPRYLLVDPKGEIVDKDLPRPSDREELKVVFQKHIRKK